MPPLRFTLALLCAGCTLALAGCKLMHELKPHRISRWNQGPKLGRDTANFSVGDATADRHATPGVVDRPEHRD